MYKVTKKNKEAELALLSYLSMASPAYAILVEAPWGAGKTHFVQSIWKDAAQPVRYTSLNGVSNEAAFRRALLRGSLEASLVEKGTVLGNLLSKKLHLGDLGSLARDILEERLLSNLPDILIFDDIERSTIDPQELLGLLNEFVEHQGKRVILLAHSVAHKQKDELLKQKEKLVGRTLRIEADFDAAFPDFISLMGEGRGRSYFLAHSDVVQTTFKQAGHENLRLLRNAVRDCALLLNRVDEKLFTAKEPMARFVGTYIALAMALAKGEISLQDLEKREIWKIAVQSGEVEDEFKTLNILVKRHEGADIFCHSGATFSKVLGEFIFAKGFVEDHALNRELRSTGQFEPQDENPLWKQMIYWGDLGWNDLDDLISEGNKYLFEKTSIDAGPYLQIADSMLRIQQYGGFDISRPALKQSILDRIKILGDSDSIPAAKLGVGFGWARRGVNFTFGGYGCDANSELLEIMDAMTSAQINAYGKTIPKDAHYLLTKFETDLDKFLTEISYDQHVTNYYHVPIFHMVDKSRFTKAVVKYFVGGRGSDLGQVFEKLAERHRDEDGWLGEKHWFNELRDELAKEASGRSKLARAQLDHFFGFHWKFASKVGVDGT